MGTITELGLKLVRGTYPGSDHKAPNATIFLPEDFPFSAQSLGKTIEAIRDLFGDDAWGSMSAGFNEQDGMGIMFCLPEGKENESLEVVRTADLPLGITQPEGDKAQLKLLAVQDATALIEPAQVITSTQIRDMIRTRPLEIQEIANGYWRVSLRDGYLRLHTEHGSFSISRLTDEAFRSTLTPNYPYITERVTAYIFTEDGNRTGSMYVQMRLDNHEAALGQETLDAAASLDGFANVTSEHGHITAGYTGPETQIVHPINQGTALKEIILDFMLKLGIFPADATLYISLPAELNEKPVAVINFPFGVVAGRYSFPN